MNPDTCKLKPNQFTLPSGPVITEIPVLYSTAMVQANMEDRKTQTRREVKNYPKGDQALDLGELYKHNPEYFYEISPYGRPGDMHWVRETWRVPNPYGKPRYLFRATWESYDTGVDFKWKPSIHMPKAASRIWAMVEEIRVERLWDISKEDAISEGILPYPCPIGGEDVLGYKNYIQGNMPEPPVISFHSLWVSINGFDSWDTNPWVWVIKYRILSKTGRPDLGLIEYNYWDIVTPKSETI